MKNKNFLREKVKQIAAIEEKLYGKMSKTRKIVSAAIGASTGFFTGYEFMEMYNLFYDTSLVALYTQNELELNQMQIDLLIAGVEPDKIHLPVFSDGVKEQLASYGIDETASTSQVILDAMSTGVFDFSNLDPVTGGIIATLVGLSTIFTGFEINNFLKNRVRRKEQIKIAQGQDPTFMEEMEEEEKRTSNQKNNKNKSNYNVIKF